MGNRTPSTISDVLKLEANCKLAEKEEEIIVAGGRLRIAKVTRRKELKK
jgi:hypothetical protein